MNLKLGYACINMTLQSEGVTTNRSMIKRTFEEKGMDYASELGLKNAKDLYKILNWNKENGIFLFRMTSGLIPWASEFEIEDLKDYEEIKYWLKKSGDYSKEHGIRVTSHPGPFNVLTSPKESVVENTFKDLTMHAQIFDMMGLERSTYNKINIHCNGVYGDKIKAMDRFCDNFNKLPESVKSRLTVENDDKSTMYSVKDLMYIHNKIGIPIVFDYHHHQFNSGGLSEEQALKLAISTWKEDIIPIVHYSESKRLHENNESIKEQAHSDYIHKLPNTYGMVVNIMVEAKKKEKAILPFIGLDNVEWYSGLVSIESYR